MQSITNQQKIHFFEYLQVQTLHQYIEGGIKYFITAILNSDKLVHLRYLNDEISLVISVVKDLYFLVKSKCIYAENFFGLQRVSNTLQTNNNLSKKEIVMSIILWHVVPYLFAKLQKMYKKIQENQQNPTIVKYMFVKMFPVCYMIVKVIQTILKFRYLMIRSSKFYNLQYLFSKLQTTYKQVQQEQYQYPLFVLMKSPGLFLLLISHKIASYFFNHRTNHKSINHQRNQQQIQAPLVMKKLQEEQVQENIQRNRKKKQCPICGQMCKNPAVLKCSGYVYCYSCIYQYVKNYTQCPITKIAAEEDSIQILYD